MLIHSVVLTVYNAPFDVDLCLRSLASSLDFLQVELILVDDASKQETQKILDDFIAQYPQAVLVRHAENKGYLHSVNDGIRHAHGDIVTLLNSDTFIPAGLATVFWHVSQVPGKSVSQAPSCRTEILFPCRLRNG